MKHCATCTCETRAERDARIERERQEAERKRRELEFVKHHSVLSAEDIAWAQQQLRGAS